MTNFNYWFVLIAFLLYFICSGVTLRDRILVHSMHQIEANALGEPSPKLLFEGAMNGMVRKLYQELQDDYSDYIPYVDQKEYEENLGNRFDGIGIIYRQDPLSRQSEIIYPILDSPAYRAGLRSGDVLQKVDGKSVDDLPVSEISELFKGEPGKKIVLTVLPFGKTESRRVAVKREPIRRDSVEGDGIDGDGKRIFRLEDRPRIGYLRITSFSDRTADEVQAALDWIEQNECESLILDLRDNPGGYVSVSVQIANRFIRPQADRDVIVSTRYRNGKIKAIYRAHELGKVFDLPMAVLVDGETASAAEILSACLQDYRRATIVGTRSFGKGVVQEIFNLPLNSGTLQLTDASYWRPNGRNIQRSPQARESDSWGVTPDRAGELPVSEWQRFALLQIRERRANAVHDAKDAYMSEYLRRLPKEIETVRKKMEEDEGKADDREEMLENGLSDEETENRLENRRQDKTESGLKEQAQTGLPFVLEGKSPYFDPQLDRAVEILEKGNSGE